MIVVRLKGGLGNQMFQYALGRALAQANGTEFAMDKDFHLANDPQRKYGLGAFNIEERFASSCGLPVVAEKSLRFEPSVFFSAFSPFGACFVNATGDVAIDGYWQSERYFLSAERLIRQDFTLRYPIDAAEIRGNSAFIHVRRGDYVGNSVQRCLPIEYYQRGAEYIAQRMPDARFFVFSDDLAWCRQNLKLRHPVTFVDYRIPHEALYLMGQCRHGVISASSFSWWGAWMTGEDGVIVAPERWFEAGELDATDIIPSRWVKI